MIASHKTCGGHIRAGIGLSSILDKTLSYYTTSLSLFEDTALSIVYQSNTSAHLPETLSFPSP